LSDNDIKTKSLDELLKHLAVQTLFTTPRFIESTSPVEFANEVSLYIDASPTFSSGESSCTTRWPLIKKVTLYLNSPAIQSGVSLIDLPGVGDTNSARSEQASKYLSRCDAIWIVADIVRAETDDVAIGLLSKAMKRELLMDGLYNAATFICTRTDNPDCEDLAKRMHLEQLNGEYASLVSQLRGLNQSIFTVRSLMLIDRASEISRRPLSSHGFAD
jgi:hypothetical protein